MQWFIERGFDEVSVDDLPPSRKASYNHARKSKIYMKRLAGTARELDEEELKWDN
jgi:amino-acid N-acetyltransferase